MTEKDQEKLFKRIRRKFRNWPAETASGYLAGLLDESTRPQPTENTIEQAKDYQEGTKRINGAYCLGYCYGFADARGIDALETGWAKTLEFREKTLEFQWWQEEN